ncbi:MAG: DUF2127 domain-containing protein [Myxococcaceae bacterium]
MNARLSESKEALEAKREPALTAIIAYKFARAAAAAAVAILLVVLVATGETHHFETFVRGIHDQATSHIAWVASHWLLKALGARNVHLAIGALVLDSGVVFLEGFSLMKNWWWGPWLVALASGGPVPFEIAAIAHHPGPIRILVLVVNLAIVAYLMRRTWVRHRQDAFMKMVRYRH